MQGHRELIQERVNSNRNYISAINGAENKGREEGRAEERAKAAKNALSLGLSIEQVAQISGLSKSEIEELKNNM